MDRFGDVVGSFPARLTMAEAALAEPRLALLDGDVEIARVWARQLRYAIENVERAAIVVGLDQVEHHEVTTAALFQLQAAAYSLLEHIRVDGPISARRFLARLRLPNTPRDGRERSHDG
jgi:hypothetical protein